MNDFLSRIQKGDYKRATAILLIKSRTNKPLKISLICLSILILLEAGKRLGEALFYLWN